MTATIIFISLLVPFAVQRFAVRQLGAGAFVSALMGAAAAILLGGGLESGAYASTQAVAVVVLSATLALVLDLADARDSSLGGAVLMAAGTSEATEGALSSIPLAMRVAADRFDNASRPVMIFNNAGEPSGFSGNRAA